MHKKFTWRIHLCRSDPFCLSFCLSIHLSGLSLSVHLLLCIHLSLASLNFKEIPPGRRLYRIHMCCWVYLVYLKPNTVIPSNKTFKYTCCRKKGGVGAKACIPNSFWGQHFQLEWCIFTCALVKLLQTGWKAKTMPSFACIGPDIVRAMCFACFWKCLQYFIFEHEWGLLCSDEH